MGQLIEYTLVSADGVFTGSGFGAFLSYRDDAYLRDGLGVIAASSAMLYGRKTYEAFARLWPGRDHPWANHLNRIKKYVFSSTLDGASWENTSIVRGDVVEEVRKLKEAIQGDLLIFGHTQVAVALMRAGLVDLLDLSIHPEMAGSGGLLLREGLNVHLNLLATKSFSKIVKLCYRVVV